MKYAYLSILHPFILLHFPAEKYQRDPNLGFKLGFEDLIS